MEQLKVAMARIIINVIQADGIIDDREMAFLEKVKYEFGITNEDFTATRHLTFSNALALFKASYRKYQNTIDKFITAIDELATTDNVVSANEAMILLSIKYVVKKGCYPLSYCGEVGFSKREVIFLDSDDNGVWERQLDGGLYETVRNSFLGYGFRFIFIPKVKESLKGKSEKTREILQQIVQYLYPNKPSNKINDIIEQLNTISTSKFSSIIADILGCSIYDFTQSLLFKVTTSDIYNEKTQKFDTHDDLVIFHLSGGIEKTLSILLNEFVKYVGVLNNNTTIYPEDYFNFHGFHKTLLDSVVLSLNIKKSRLIFNLLTNENKRISFKDVTDFSMGDTYLCTYMVVIYMSCNSAAKRDEYTYELFRKTFNFVAPKEKKTEYLPFGAKVSEDNRTTKKKILCFDNFKDSLPRYITDIRNKYIKPIHDLPDKDMFEPVIDRTNGESVYFVSSQACANTFVKLGSSDKLIDIETFFKKFILRESM